MKKLIIEEKQPNKITRNSDFDKVLVEDEQPNKIIRSRDKVIVRKQYTKTK